jgi:ketosteroid isomerase-like protein
VASNADLVRAVLPSPEVDLANLFRDQDAFEETTAALAGIFDPNLESVAVWAGEGRTYTGMDGFRRLWLDWLEPWVTYHVRVEEIIEAGDRVVVLIRDRGRRHDTEAEVELISGSIWTVRGGRIARTEFYANRDDLFEAHGLGRAAPDERPASES